MLDALEALLPGAQSTGSGLIFPVSPFQRIVPIGFYDGVTEGVSNSDSVVAYFRMAWCDQQQDNRLFETFIVPKSALSDPHEIDMLSKIDSAVALFGTSGQSEDWSSIGPLICRNRAVMMAHILCRSISGPLFLLPALGD